MIKRKVEENREKGISKKARQTFCNSVSAGSLAPTTLNILLLTSVGRGISL
jgi:hypothetical protein